MTKQRLSNTFDIPTDIKAQYVKSSKDTGVEISWPDGHKSIFPTNFLRRNAYSQQVSFKPVVQPRPKILWNNAIVKSMPEPVVKFADVMESDSGVAAWLKNIDIFGFSYVSGVPADIENTEKLARRIAFIRETHYGGFWDFSADMSHSDTAYTNLAIGAHTDSTYFTDPVGLQLFHLLKHTGEGGHTLLVDGFRAADHIRKHHPNAFETLTTVKIPTHSAGDPNAIMRPTPHAGFPVISMDPNDQDPAKLPYQIRYNNHDRSCLSGKNGFTAEKVDALYSALRIWHETITKPENELWLKMQPGKAVIADNWRVMHGRSSFNGYRRLCGAYIGFDDYKSRIATVLDKHAEKADL